MRRVRQTIYWADRRLPHGIRFLLGVILCVAGVFGFLPVLGFWMLPVGLALMALDIPPLRRRLLAWAERTGRQDGAHTETSDRTRS